MSSISEADWRFIGPAHLTGLPDNVLPCAGRIDGMDFSQDYDGSGNPALYLAMPGGGIWRSPDFMSISPTWTPLTDHLPGISDARRVDLNVVSTLAVDPKNSRIIYARAGGTPAAVLKSTDGGNAWTLVGGFSGAIWRVMADPLGTVYVALNSGGFWRSLDGGNTWKNIAASNLSGVEFHDAVYFNNGNQLSIYVGVIDRQGQNRSGIWKFTNEQWIQMPMTLSNFKGQAFASSIVNHITLAVNAAAGVCASLSQIDDDKNEIGLLNVFKLANGEWQPQFLTPDYHNTQQGYVQGLCIAPDGRIYVGSRGLNQSAGGQSLISIEADANGKKIHVDVHAIAAYQEKIYVATDGGLFRFTPRLDKPGVPQWEELNTVSLGNFLSTSVSANPTNPFIDLVGNQDNGIARRSLSGDWTHSAFSNEFENVRFDPDPANNGHFAFFGDPATAFIGQRMVD